MKRNRSARSLTATALAAFLLFFLAACGGGGDSGDPGVSASITLSVTDEAIPADGASSTIITAVVKDSSGKPVHHGTDVTFTTTLGRFENGSTTYTVQTLPPFVDGKPDPTADPTGTVEVALMAGTTSGTAKVTVRSIGVSQTIYISFTGLTAVITLEADPTSIPADGASSSTIKATLTTTTGAPVHSGTEVTFTTGLGLFQNGEKSYTGSTIDSTGIVQVSFRAGIVPGTTYVVATSGGVTQSVSIVLTDRYASTMTIKAEPPAIPADGVSTSLVTATIKRVSGAPLAEVPVTFYDANAETEPAPLPDDNTWKGLTSNDHVTPDFYCYSGNVSYSMTYSGSETSNFAVRLWNRDTMKVDAILINTTGPVTEETVTRSMTAGNYFFQVTAEGEWQIKVDGSIGQAQAGTPKVLAVTETDEDGNATYLYRSTTIPGVIKIRAESGQLNVTENKEALNATVEITQYSGPAKRITLTARDTHIYANGANSTTITATVFDSTYNPAPDGTVVTFSATEGALNPTTAETLDGEASVTLTSVESATSITSTVTATVGEYSDSTTVTFVGVTLTDMKADPAQIIANGTDTSTISIRLQNESGTAVSNETIYFSTTGGTITPPGYAVTDGQGLASIELIAPVNIGSATVTATYGLIKRAADVSFVNSPVGTVSVAPGSSAVVADGKSSTVISAEVKNQDGKPIEDGTEVGFTTSAGTLSADTATTVNGVAKVTLTSSTTVGTATVTAVSGGVNGTTAVSFIAGPVMAVALKADPDNLSADGVSTSTIQATARDAYGNPVSGETINFVAQSGSLSAASAVTDESGVATLTYTAPDGLPSGGGDTVTGTATNGTTGSVAITLIQPIVGSVTVAAGSSELVADGVSSTIIVAEVKDRNENHVPDGTAVSFTATAGALSSGSATTINGLATVILISPTNLGSALITATSGGVNATTTVAFIAGGVDTVILAAVPDNLSADGVSTSTIQATARDANGNPVAGETISFVAHSGSLSAATALTNESGVATVTYTAPDAVPSGGGDTVTGTATNGTTGSVAITLIQPIVGSVTVAVGSSELVADGVSSTIVIAEVKDRNENHVPDGTAVSFASTAGTLSSGSATTINGLATVILTSPTNLGSALITATSGGVSATTTVAFVAGGVARISLAAVPDNLSADGVSTSSIHATVTDARGNPVSGETVSFTVHSGTLSAATALTNESGVATVTYTAPDTVPSGGTDTVTGRSTNGTTGSVAITLIQATVGSVTVTAASSELVADGMASTLISALVKDLNGETVEDGTTVTFTTTAGTLSSSTALTFEGVATVTLTSPTTLGTALVMATAGGVTGATNVKFIAGPVDSLMVSPSPATLLADGTSTSSVRARATDAMGHMVADGEVIAFAITSGTGSLSASSAPTAAGFATVIYTASKTPGPVVIQAMAENGVSSMATIILTSGQVGSVTLTASPDTIPADGSSSSAITAVLKDAGGNPVVRGTFVTFSTNLGSFSNGSTTMTASTIGDSGEVTVSLIAGQDSGTALVTAASGGVTQTVQVEFTGAPDVDKVEVTADPVEIPADGKSTSVISATVKTADNQLIPDVEVTFATESGAITSPHTTDQNGVAQATLRSDRCNSRSVKVTATCQGVEGVVYVSFTGMDLDLQASPTNLPVGSYPFAQGDGSTITATLRDAASNPVPNTILTFTTDKGTFNADYSLTQVATDTDSSGKAVVTLYSTESGANKVTAVLEGDDPNAPCAQAETTVQFSRYLLTLEADPTTIRVGETSQVTATLLESGVGRSGETVSFSSTLGSLFPQDDVTGGDGKATTTLTAGAQAGVATVGANVTIATDTPPTELSAATQVVITGGDADKIVLTASPDIISTDTGVSTIRASVYDANDQPSPDQDIYFRINLAPAGGEYLSASTATTDDYGVATVIFYAGTLPSDYQGVEIEANTEPDFSGSKGLALLTIAGPVAHMGVGMNLETLEPDGGNLKIDISAIATDVNGNPVADGTKVSFSVQAVEFDEDRANDHIIDCWDSMGVPLVPCPPTGTPGFGVTWFSDDVNQDGTMYSLGGPMSTTEDVNHNGILDPGEDKNDNGVIDPVQGTVIDESVDTQGGVAPATLIYPAPQANNIKVRVTASAGGVSNFYETILLCTEKMVDQGTCGIGY